MLKALMESDFPGIEVLPIDAFPQGEHAVGSDSTIQQVRESGVDRMIIGNAAGGLTVGATACQSGPPPRPGSAGCCRV
jgi:hypothetical protein